MKPVFVPSRAQTLIMVGRITAKHTQLQLTSGHTLHFWEKEIVAVVSSGCVWYRPQTSGAVTKMLAGLEPQDGPRIAQSAAEFDYTVGQALTIAGLPLTRMESK